MFIRPIKFYLDISIVKIELYIGTNSIISSFFELVYFFLFLVIDYKPFIRIVLEMKQIFDNILVFQTD